MSVSLDGAKWYLWCDDKADWRSDKLFLPGEFELSELPYNPPACGWEKLYRSGIEVMLPATVEQYFWGKYGWRDYTENDYRFAAEDNQVKNGSYLGVSWWWTTFKAPKDIAGKLAFLEMDGVRLRAEIFVNEKLVGYDLIGETPFSVDLTGKIKPGEINTLAIRITSPGGRLDWRDNGYFDWGSYKIPLSHSFSGINRGVKIEFRPKCYVSSVFVMSKPNPADVNVRCEIVNSSAKAVDGKLSVNIEGTKASKTIPVSLKPGSNVVDCEFSVPDARLWSVEQPNLYSCRASLESGLGADSREARFGFHWLDAAGIGDDAKFLWNGKRIVLRSAISWGYWGGNGLWPNDEMAKREVLSAKALGLNCLNFHRTIGKPLTLDLQDRMGLLRMQEPGAGSCIVRDSDFARKYMKIKIARMVERDRNHPSMVCHIIQNELPGIVVPNDDVEETLRMMHSIDPTRPMVLKSGNGAEGQAFMLPYDDNLYMDPAGSGYSGWWDKHTVGGPGIWRDDLYVGPDEWSHASDNKKEIVIWGETLGVGTPDMLAPVWEYYKSTGKTGYDRQDNAEQYAAMDSFLDERGFRAAFPTVADLTGSINEKSYYFWGRILENARISDPVDCMVVSGWESTSIENHAGLVDSHRYLKSYPELMSLYCLPLHLAIKPRRLVVETGESITADLHIVNETGEKGGAKVYFGVEDPVEKIADEMEFDVSLTGGDVYGQLLKSDIVTDCYDKPGYYTLGAMIFQDEKILTGIRENVLVVDNAAPSVSGNGAIFDPMGVAKSYLASKGIDLPGYSTDMEKLDFLIVAGDIGGSDGFFDGLMRRVREDGTALVFWTTGANGAEPIVKAMERRGVLASRGRVGQRLSSWMGCWTVVRDHPLMDGLPVNTALNWEYQADGIDGFMVDADGIEWVSAYGRDHNRNVGTTYFTLPYGRGEIILNCIDDPYNSLAPGRPGLVYPVSRHMLLNAVKYASDR